ncbi:MAG: hypothetical protein ACRDTG_09750, partial [Pseudonocardiaceae bacterium]
MTTHGVDLSGIVLATGAHDSPEDGYCLMEAVTWIQGRVRVATDTNSWRWELGPGTEWTDQPACVSEVLAEFGRQLNDLLPDEQRQQLVPLIPLLLGTAGDGKDETRRYLALDWLIRNWLPTWLDLVPACREDASALRALGRIADVAAAKRAALVVGEARGKARAARAAAGDAARA